MHDYDMALRLDPNEVELLYDRGNTRRQSGDWRALADYDRAVVLAPQRPETYFARGWSRFCAGVEGADLDARVYLKLKGWRDSLSPYMAILAALAGRKHSALKMPNESLTRPSLTSLRASGRLRCCDTCEARSLKRPCWVLPLVHGSKPKLMRLSASTTCSQATAPVRFLTCNGRETTATMVRSRMTSHGQRLSGSNQPIAEKSGEPTCWLSKLTLSQGCAGRDAELVAVPFRSDAGSGPTRATMLPIASLATMRTLKSASGGSDCIVVQLRHKHGDDFCHAIVGCNPA